MKLDIDWTIKSPEKFDLDKFRRYLRDYGHRQSTIDSYLVCISKYLQSKKSVPEFLDDLHSRKLAGSTIDNYITSIKKYHDARKAKEAGIAVIDAGHYGTEKIFVPNMAAKLRKALGSDVEIIESQVDIDPFTTI